jgi:hypothetical protein
MGVGGEKLVYVRLSLSLFTHTMFVTFKMSDVWKIS